MKNNVFFLLVSVIILISPSLNAMDSNDSSFLDENISEEDAFFENINKKNYPTNEIEKDKKKPGKGNKLNTGIIVSDLVVEWLEKNCQGFENRINLTALKERFSESYPFLELKNFQSIMQRIRKTIDNLRRKTIAYGRDENQKNKSFCYWAIKNSSTKNVTAKFKFDNFTFSKKVNSNSISNNNPIKNNLSIKKRPIPKKDTTKNAKKPKSTHLYSGTETSFKALREVCHTTYLKEKWVKELKRWYLEQKRKENLTQNLN